MPQYTFIKIITINCSEDRPAGQLLGTFSVQCLVPASAVERGKTSNNNNIDLATCT